MKFRTGTLYTQKMAHLYGRATSSSCLLRHQPDSQIHMLSGCQHASIQNMVTERHNIASRLIIKTLNKGDFGGHIIFTDIGSETRMAQQKSGLAYILHIYCTRILYTSSTKPVSRQTSIMLKTRCYLHTASWNEKWPSKRHTGYIPFVYNLCAGMYTSLK